jgi:predicted negative regulator of RcsB-dependent stress response
MADPQAPNARELVRRISERLHAAAAVAKAAEACVEAGDTDQALAMLREIERQLYEMTTLLNAASILRGNHTRNTPRP